MGKQEVKIYDEASLFLIDFHLIIFLSKNVYIVYVKLRLIIIT